MLSWSQSFSSGVLTFNGGSAGESLTLNDNGAGTISFSGTGLSSGSRSSVATINVNGNGGDDTVTYNLNTATSGAQLTINCHLGDGQDRFNGNFRADINNRRTFNVFGDGGNDVITVTADTTFRTSGIRIASLTSLNLDLEGNSGSTAFASRTTATWTESCTSSPCSTGWSTSTSTRSTRWRPGTSASTCAPTPVATAPAIPSPPPTRCWRCASRAAPAATRSR
jgi:hypothetical protein